jgi:hydrogenase maturation protease
VSFSQAYGASLMTKSLVVGIGNPDRGDDGIGPLVARRLAGRAPPDVTIIERAGDVVALIEDWAGYDSVILIDAAAPGATPGSIHRVDLMTTELPADISLSSTHAFGVGNAVGLARTLGLLPRSLVVYAIEGVNFEPGAHLSPNIAAAVEEVVARVMAELGFLKDERTAETTHA